MNNNNIMKNKEDTWGKVNLKATMITNNGSSKCKWVLINKQLVCTEEWQALRTFEDKARINLLILLKITGINQVRRVIQRILANSKSAKNLSLRMALVTKVSGKTLSAMVKESRFGQMAPSMRDTGKIIRLMERVLSGTYMVTNTKVSGKEIKLTVTVNILTVTVQPMKVIGEMIFSMVKVLNSGTIIQSTRVNIKEERSMVRVPILGKMVPNILVSGMRIEFMVVASTPGTMVESMKVTGKITIWMATVSTLGRTVGSMKDNTRKIRNMEMVFIPGLMAVNMTDSGKMVANMDVENTYRNKVNTEKVFGRMEKERNGWMKTVPMKCET